MKRIIALVLILSFCLPLIACGQQEAEIHIPEGFLGELRTQEEYNDIAVEMGWKSITINDDESLTYVMSKAQYDQILEDKTQENMAILDDMIQSEMFPTIVKIDVKDHFTKFEVTIEGEKVNPEETIALITFFTMSNAYNIYNGTQGDSCDVIFVSQETGDVIQTFNSEDFNFS